MNPSPRIWNVPHNRNPLFIGRTDELNQLRQTFGVGGFAAQKERGQSLGGPLGAAVGRGDVVALTQTIAGLGGIGKTSLATEYCYKHQNEYDVVWWLRSQESATLASDYAALAVKLDASYATEPNLPKLIAFVLDWLRLNERWLLIFDNANAPQEIRAYLPPVGSGHILITSRESVWDEIGKTVALPTLPRDEAIRFLLEHTQEQDRNAANALAHELGDFPLALEHARAYVKQSNSSLAHYLELYRTRRTQLWRETKTPLNYHSTIATTWDISIQQAAAQSPSAADLLNLCAFFAPDEIPLDVIVRADLSGFRKPERSLTDPLILDNAIAALRHYSLIERKENNLSVHRLVQAVTREKLDEPARKQWAEAAVRIVNEAYPFESDDVTTWNDCARLLQHGLAAAEHAEIAAIDSIASDDKEHRLAMTIASEQTARLLNQMGLYLKGRAQFQDAKTLYERALVVYEKALGSEHEYVATTVNNLGLVLQDLGDLECAKVYLERALAIDEKQFGREHPKVAIRVNNLGTVLFELGDLQGAKAHYERALAIWEKQLGAEHPKVAIGNNNLGSVLFELGDLEGAKVYFERALAIDEKQFGREHPNVARDVNNLGSVLFELGDLEGAKVYFERALAIDEKQFGREHPNVARDVNNLGSVLKDLGDLAEAKTHYERASAIWEKQLGMEHSQVAVANNNLGSLSYTMGEIQEAKQYHQRALAIREKIFGNEHPDVGQSVWWLGTIAEREGDKETARMYLERALKIFQKFLGDEHPTTQTAKRNLERLGGELPADNAVKGTASG